MLQAEEPTTVLLERWRLRYEPHNAAHSSISWPTFYKRFMVLLRSLLAQLRLLPSHRLATSLAKLRGTGGVSPLQYAISLPRSPATQPAPAGLGFAAGAQQFSFPVPDGAHGKLDLGVLYRPSMAGRVPSPVAAVCVAASSAAAYGSPAAASEPASAVAASAPPGGLGAAVISDYMRSAAAAAARQEERTAQYVGAFRAPPAQPPAAAAAPPNLPLGQGPPQPHSLLPAAQAQAYAPAAVPPAGPPAGRTEHARARSQSVIADDVAFARPASPPTAASPSAPTSGGFMRPRAMSDGSVMRPRTHSDAASYAAEIRAAAMGVRDPFTSTTPISAGALPNLPFGASVGLSATTAAILPSAADGSCTGRAAISAPPFPAVAASPPISFPVAASAGVGGTTPPFMPAASPPCCSSLSAALAAGGPMHAGVLGRSPSDTHSQGGTSLLGSRGGSRASHSHHPSRPNSRPQSHVGSPLDGGLFPAARLSPYGSPTDGALFPHANLPFGGGLPSVTPVFASVPEAASPSLASTRPPTVPPAHALPVPSMPTAQPATAESSSGVDSNPSTPHGRASAAAATTPHTPRDGVYSSAGHEPLPFAMDEGDDDGGGLLGGDDAAGDAMSASRRRQSSRGGDEAIAEAAIGSLMMEVSAAPSLQLFSNPRDGRASPLSRSVEDITSQLDRLTRTFHVAGPGRDVADGQLPPSASPHMLATAPPRGADYRSQRQLGFHSANTSPVGSPLLPPTIPLLAHGGPPATSIGVSLHQRGSIPIERAMPRTSNTSSNQSPPSPPSDGMLFGALPPGPAAARPQPLVPVPLAIAAPQYAPVPPPAAEVAAPRPAPAPPEVVAPPAVGPQGSTEALLAAAGAIGGGDTPLFPFAPTAHPADDED